MVTQQSWEIDSQFYGGNSAGVQVISGSAPEVRFTPNPRGARPLWFCLRISPAPGAAAGAESGKLRLVLEHYETLAGAKHPGECCPVFKPAGQWWMRLPAGKPELAADGRAAAVWTVNPPAAPMEVALGFPYADGDLRQLLERSRGFWHADTIGLSAGGNPLVRLANEYNAGARFPGGLYLVARARGCDMPAAWVLDGMLQRFAGAKNNPFLIWAVALADPDAAQAGAWHSAPDLAGDWTDTPARPETAVLGGDIAHWRAACRPALAVNLQAAPLHEKSGIYCELPDAQRRPEWHAQALKWAHVVQHKLGPEFAAPEFARAAPAPAPGAGSFHDWLADGPHGVCAVTLQIPWSGAGETGFSPKKYREAGRNIADALIEKRR